MVSGGTAVKAQVCLAPTPVLWEACRWRNVPNRLNTKAVGAVEDHSCALETGDLGTSLLVMWLNFVLAMPAF